MRSAGCRVPSSPPANFSHHADCAHFSHRRRKLKCAFEGPPDPDVAAVVLVDDALVAPNLLQHLGRLQLPELETLMRTGMCMDMRVDMCMDMRIDVFTDGTLGSTMRHELLCTGVLLCVPSACLHRCLHRCLQRCLHTSLVQHLGRPTASANEPGDVTGRLQHYSWPTTAQLTTECSTISWPTTALFHGPPHHYFMAHHRTISWPTTLLLPGTGSAHGVAQRCSMAVRHGRGRGARVR